MARLGFRKAILALAFLVTDDGEDLPGCESLQSSTQEKAPWGKHVTDYRPASCVHGTAVVEPRVHGIGHGTTKYNFVCIASKAASYGAPYLLKRKYSKIFISLTTSFLVTSQQPPAVEAENQTPTPALSGGSRCCSRFSNGMKDTCPQAAAAEAAAAAAAVDDFFCLELQASTPAVRLSALVPFPPFRRAPNPPCVQASSVAI